MQVELCGWAPVGRMPLVVKARSSGLEDQEVLSVKGTGNASQQVAQGHREPDGEGRGAHVVSTALVSGGEDTEHELQCQEKLHSNGLAGCRVVVELGTEEGDTLSLLPTLVSSSCPPAARDPDRPPGTIRQGARATLVHTTGGF